MDTLEAKEFLANIPYINHGGCLIAALAFYLNEEKEGRAKHLNIAAVYDDDYSGDLFTNRQFIRHKASAAESAPHFGWTYDNGECVEDCMDNETSENDVILVIPQNLTVEFSISALNNGSWNTVFEREKYIPVIAKAFDIEAILSQVHVYNIGGAYLA